MPLPSAIHIDSRNLLIRPVEEADLADLLLANGDDAVTRYLPYRTWQSLEDGTIWLTRMRAIESTGTGAQLVIVEKETAVVIGTCLLFRYEEPSARCEVGYLLRRQYWGRGYMHEALTALISHAIDAVGIRRLEAEVDPRNVSSCNLLERLGFTEEGLLRKRWITKGETCDTRIYGLLREEWRAQHRDTP